jgi:hypothetical protein
VKKIGSETPASATDIMPRSSTDPRLSADTMPVPTPVISQMNAAPPASEAVTGIRACRSGQTGCWVRNEYPKQGAGQCSVVGP